MYKGGGGRLSLLKSTTISLVFFTLMQRLFPLHHCIRCSTSSLYSDSSLSVMRPTTAVSSANFTIWQLGCLAEQSYVSRVNRRGLSTQPCGEPVLRVMEEEMVLWILTVWGLLVRKSKTQFPSVGLRPREESFYTRVCGMMVLKAEEKSRKSRRTLEFLLSKWVRAVWTTDEMASSVEHFFL